jgi:hypothetical protein
MSLKVEASDEALKACIAQSGIEIDKIISSPPD